MRAAMGILAKNATINSGEIIYRYRDNKGGIDYDPDLDKDAQWKETDILKMDKAWKTYGHGLPGSHDFTRSHNVDR